jgi:hypothetical protein
VAPGNRLPSIHFEPHSLPSMCCLIVGCHTGMQHDACCMRPALAAAVAVACSPELLLCALPPPPPADSPHPAHHAAWSTGAHPHAGRPQVQLYRQSAVPHCLCQHLLQHRDPGLAGVYATAAWLLPPGSLGSLAAQLLTGCVLPASTPAMLLHPLHRSSVAPPFSLQALLPAALATGVPWRLWQGRCGAC